MAISAFLTPFERRNTHKQSRGFSLIEILVVIAIISILATILLGYSRNSARQIFLVSLITKTEALIANARASSIQTFFNEPSLDNVHICAHGIEFNLSDKQAHIFQIRSEGAVCPDRDQVSQYHPDGLGSNLIREDDLPGSSYQLDFNSNQFSSVDLRVDGHDGSLYMIFIPPDPIILLSDGKEVLDEELRLIIQVDNLIGSVTATEYGQVDTRYFDE